MNGPSESHSSGLFCDFCTDAIESPRFCGKSELVLNTEEM